MSMKKAVFLMTGWYMPYSNLVPFVIIKQYGEGKMIRVIIFVSVY